MKKEYKLDYPNTFPAIQDLIVSNNKIYIQTYKKQENKEEWRQKPERAQAIPEFHLL